jgi:5-methylcytosine-specific restriction endonuclease McrA
MNARARSDYGIKTIITPEELVAVLDTYDWRCVYCGPDEYLCFDHIVSLRRGGIHTAKNLQILCRSCNGSKHDRSDEEALRYREEWERILHGDV